MVGAGSGDLMCCFSACVEVQLWKEPMYRSVRGRVAYRGPLS